MTGIAADGSDRPQVTVTGYDANGRALWQGLGGYVRTAPGVYDGFVRAVHGTAAPVEMHWSLQKGQPVSVDRNDFGANAEAQRVVDQIRLDMDAARASTSGATQSTTLHGATLHPTCAQSDLTSCTDPELIHRDCWAGETIPGTGTTCKALVDQANELLLNNKDQEVAIAANERLETIGAAPGEGGFCQRCLRMPSPPTNGETRGAF
jgi:hypothetical protein